MFERQGSLRFDDAVEYKDTYGRISLRSSEECTSDMLNCIGNIALTYEAGVLAKEAGVLANIKNVIVKTLAIPVLSNS